jgi:hypothetical protein
MVETLAFLGLIGACVILVRWRFGLLVLFLLVIVEGAIRKWALPAFQEYIYFVKDGVLLLTALAFLADPGSRRRAPKLPGGYVVLLAAYTLLVLAEIANPRLPNLALGVFGAKAHLLYILLIFMMPAAFPNIRQATRCLRRYLYLCLPVIGLALIQVSAPVDSPLNTYVGNATQAMGTATFGDSGLVRTTGTFSYISGFVAFGFFGSALSFGLLAARRWRLSGNSVVLLSLLGCCGAFLLSGSRGPVWTWFALSPIVMFLLVRRRLIDSRLAAASLTFVGIAAAVMALGFAGIYEGFLQRVQAGIDSGESAQRVWNTFAVPLLVWPEAGISGYGAGAAHPASGALAPDVEAGSWLPLSVEGELERIALELGVMGQLLVVALRVTVCVYAWNLMKHSRQDDIFGLVLFLFIFLAANIFGHLVFNSTAGVLYWGSVGLLFWLRELQTHDAAHARLSRAHLSSRPAVFRPAGLRAS